MTRHALGRFIATGTLVVLITMIACPDLFAQPARGNNQAEKKADDKKPKPPPPLPTDKRLLELHKAFVRDAEKLAGEYERSRDWDKAKDVYGEILKLVPQYTDAQTKMDAILQREASAETKKVKVQADDDWQYSGVVVQEGKPVTIRASGKWTFVLEAEISADGIPIPKELREFNLGTLVGYIDTGDREKDKPFAIGSGKEMIAPKSGKLYLRMYDMYSRDNDGFLSVEIQGTFGQQ